jgi:multidrug efflux pump subunit AcrB
MTRPSSRRVLTTPKASTTTRGSVPAEAAHRAAARAPNDLYCQLGLVLLIGLAARNSILIVEFAAQLRAKGLAVIDDAVEAARIRLRPILMTSLAFILGVMPLVFATFLNILVIPVLTYW